MLHIEEEILADLEATLDQLIENASVISESTLQVLDSFELNSLYKTQESLLARFAHIQEDIPQKALIKRYEQLHKKVEKINKLNERLMQSLEKKLSPRIGRNRRASKMRKLAKCTL